jgi:hypothetical protein
VHFSSLPQRILKRLYRRPALTGPKAKDDPGQIYHVTISNHAGCLALRQSQFDNSIHLFKPGLNPLRLLEMRVRNNRPAALTILQKPFHRPLVNPARGSDQPGPAVRQKWRQMLFEQCARDFAFNITRARDHYGAFESHEFELKASRAIARASSIVEQLISQSLNSRDLDERDSCEDTAHQIRLIPQRHSESSNTTNSLTGSRAWESCARINSDLLLIQNPPNEGGLSAVGPLNVNTGGLAGFDISPSGGAFASLTPPAATTTTFYTINLATGAATLVGPIGGGETIRDVAIQLPLK